MLPERGSSRPAGPKPAPDVPVAFVILLTALVMVGQMSTSMYLPSLPSLAGDLGADPGSVKLTMTVFLVAFGVAQLVFGPVSDRFGRRPALFLGLGLYVAGTGICALAPTVGWLIVGRFVQGFGACAGPAVARAVVRDRFDRSEAARILAAIGMAMAVGPAVGPMIGGLLQTLFGWRANFLALAAFGLAVWAAAAWALRESLLSGDPDAIKPVQLLRNYALLLRNRVYLGNMLATAFLFGGLFSYATGIPFVLIDLLGMSPSAFGGVFIFTVAGSLAGSTIASRAAGRVPVERMVAIGGSVALLGGTAMLTTTLTGFVNPATIVGSMMIVMIGFGITTPNALAGAMAPFPAIAGTASALLGFAQMAVAAAGSVGVAALFDGTARPMAAVIFAMGAGAVLSLALLRRPART